jgi:hypothetical protein
MLSTNNHVTTSAAAGLLALALCTGAASAGIGGAVKGLVGSAAGVAGSIVTGVSTGAANLATGALSAASGLNASGITFSGPSSTFTSAGYGNTIDVGAGGASLSIEVRTGNSGTRTRSALAAYEARQQIQGRLLSVAGSRVVVRASNGSAKPYSVTPQAAASLKPYVGKNVYLRTVDGKHVSSVIGKNDVVRGTVTSVDGNAMTFVSRNGEVRTLALTSSALSALHVRPGATVVATSNDFDRTMNIGVISQQTSSSLGSVYVGKVDSVSNGMATLGVGASQQQFRVDSTLSSQLKSLHGKTVAANSTDGVHITSLMTPATLAHLTSTSASRIGNGPVQANVLSASYGRLSVQMPNGDVESYRTTGNPASAGLRAGVPVTVMPLSSMHARIAARGHALNAADANACVTVNSTCASSSSGKALSVTPSALTMRLPSGDVRTYLGTTQSLRAHAGTPVTATPLDSTHSRLTASGKVANMLDASACVTINAGCSSVPATVNSTGSSTISLGLPNGNRTTLHGSISTLGAQPGVPVTIQPLTSTSAVVTANGHAAMLADTNICATLNARCPASTGTGSGGAPGGTGSGGGTGTGSGGAPGGTGSGGGTGFGGTTTGNDGSTGGRSPEDMFPISAGDVIAYETAAQTCSQDGQVVVRVTNPAGAALSNVDVAISGISSPHWSTSADGSVRFIHMPEGYYSATISKHGYTVLRTPQFYLSCMQAQSLAVVLSTTARASRVSARTMPHITPAVLRRSPAVATCVRTTGRNTHRYACTK